MDNRWCEYDTCIKREVLNIHEASKISDDGVDEMQQAEKSDQTSNHREHHKDGVRRSLSSRVNQVGGFFAEEVKGKYCWKSKHECCIIIYTI